MSLIEVITSSDPAVRNQPLDTLLRHASPADLLAHAASLDHFRRQCPNLYQRVRALLEAAYGNKWTPGLLNDLLTKAGSGGKSLEEWLKNDFFAQHCEIFQDRPFVWHLWDGRKDGFNVLVNYHRLAGPKGEGHRTLETLTYAYLGDWITRQKDAVAGAQ